MPRRSSRRKIFVDATYVLTNPMIPDQTTTLNGKIRGRGHSTWGQPKNPYKVQFTNDASFAQISDVLGMKKQRNWALLADYFDRSLMRNKLVFSLGNSSVFADGIKWTPSGQHVEVYLNDAYVGVYLLTEDIRIDPARLDIKKMSSSAAVNDLDGGYIVEVDVRLDCFNDGVINLQHRTPKGVLVCEDTPDEGSITQNQLAYIMNLLDSVEQDLFGPKKMDQINPVSFADWYLIQELFRNNDAAFVDQRLHVEGHRCRGQPGGPPAQHGSALGFRSFRRQHQFVRQLEDRRLLGQQVADLPAQLDHRAVRQSRTFATSCCRAGSRSGRRSRNSSTRASTPMPAGWSCRRSAISRSGRSSACRSSTITSSPRMRKRSRS